MGFLMSSSYARLGTGERPRSPQSSLSCRRVTRRSTALSFEIATITFHELVLARKLLIARTELLKRSWTSELFRASDEKCCK